MSREERRHSPWPATDIGDDSSGGLDELDVRCQEGSIERSFEGRSQLRPNQPCAYGGAVVEGRLGDQDVVPLGHASTVQTDVLILRERPRRASRPVPKTPACGRRSTSEGGGERC